MVKWILIDVGGSVGGWVDFFLQGMRYGHWNYQRGLHIDAAMKDTSAYAHNL